MPHQGLDCVRVCQSSAFVATSVIDQHVQVDY